jgi:hypothetical protein
MQSGRILTQIASVCQEASQKEFIGKQKKAACREQAAWERAFSP